MNKRLHLLALTLLIILAIGAQTLINLSTQTTGILAVANGGTGTTTAAAGTVFGRAYLAGTGAPSFIASNQIGAIPFPAVGRWLLFQATGTGTTVYGDANSAVTCSAASNVGASSTLPSYWQCATNTTNGNVAILSGDLSEVVGRHLRYQTYRQFSSAVTRRDWFGFTDQTGATMGASADPAGNRAAFGFDTGLTETTVKCSTKDNATETRNDSSIAVDTSFHYFEIVEDPGVNFKFYIDGTLVCTNTTNLPTSGTPLRVTNTTTCLTCTPTAVNLKNAWHYAQSDF